MSICEFFAGKFLKLILNFFILLFSLSGCSRTSPSPAPSNWQLISARDDGHSLERALLYRALVPAHWVRRDPPESASIADTTKANGEFFIHEEGKEIRLTVHTFSFVNEAERIPPQAQVARWKGQVEELDPLSVKLQTESHGGFSGLYFEGEGKEGIVMGWSMRLAPAYSRQLNLEKEPLDKLKRADYTLKAVGPSDMIDRHRPDIIQFAESFELIDELPPPL